MAQRIVSTAAELKSALALAKSGDVILLEDGDYGSLEIKNRKFSADVTIAAINPQSATFTDVDIRNSSHLTFLGVDAGKEFRASVNSSDITIDGVKTEQFYFRDVDGLSVDHSEAAGGWYNLVLLSVKNFSITNSYFHGATEDVSRIVGDTHNGVIENNIFAETTGAYPLHPDLMQMFKFDGATPHDLVIRGNLLWDDPATGGIAAQGIFMTDAAKGGYSNILVEQNLISVGSPNSIYIDGGQKNVVIRDNTLIDELGSKGATIRLAKKSGFDNAGTTVENNIARSLIDETKDSDIGDNYLYSTKNPSTLFQWKDGSSWSDYVPLKGTAVDFGKGYGATERLAELLSEGTFWKSGYQASDFSLPDHRFDPLYMLEGKQDFTGALGRIKALPADDFDFPEGTLAFSFEADIVGWRRTLIATNETDTSGSFLVRINNGTLEVIFGKGGHEQIVSAKGMKAHEQHDFLTSFDETGVKVWLDGDLIGSADFDVDLSDGTLLLGADNSHLASDSIAGARYPFDGRITNFLIEDEAMTPAELQDQLATIGLA